MSSNSARGRSPVPVYLKAFNCKLPVGRVIDIREEIYEKNHRFIHIDQYSYNFSKSVVRSNLFVDYTLIYITVENVFQRYTYYVVHTLASMRTELVHADFLRPSLHLHCKHRDIENGRAICEAERNVRSDRPKQSRSERVARSD